MGRTKKVVEETPVEEVVEVQNGDNVTVNLDVDPNDPRKKPIVDGNELPVVDINVPVE